MKLGRFRSWFWSIAGGASIRVKIMGIVLVLILILGLGITFQIRNSLVRTLADELEGKGVSIARDLAARSTDLILTGNSFDLYRLLEDTVESKEDVRYAFILRPDSSILSHSFDGGFPVGLSGVNPVEPDAMSRLEILDTDEGLIWDLAVPILGGRVGVARVGMSSQYFLENVAATTWRLLIYTGIISLIGLLAAYSLTSVLTRPIVHLVEVTKAIARGDLKRKAPVWASDEVGRLGVAFNLMTESLAKSRDELVLRNEELSALNSIAVTVSQSLNFEDVLENALQKVLELTRATAGCVFLRDSNGNKLEIMSSIGSSSVFKCQESSSPVTDCACHQVLRYGQTLMVNDISQCSRLGEDVVMKEDIGCFVSVPLKSKDRTLGIMNVACSSERCFTENDFRLLDSIGYHVGLAIENSVLYEEAKEKEKLRGQLLSSVISAQEEERKRIARELHDEYGQTLTGLAMSIESLENATSPKQSQLKEKLGNARSLVIRALKDLRRLTLDLRPSALDDLGLITAIRACAESHLSAAGIRVEFESKGLDERLAPAVETALFRITQETIHNIAKHAEAHNVRIQLEVKDGKIIAIIEDDGKGFDVDKVFRAGSRSHSLGLLGIQERVSLLGGTSSITSQTGCGTRLIVEIPINSSSKGVQVAKDREDRILGKFTRGDELDGKDAGIDS